MLKEFINEYLENEYVQLRNKLYLLSENLVDGVEGSFDKIRNLVSAISVWGMDTYTTSRMLTIDDSSTVIYYTGDYHTRNMRNFFLRLGQETFSVFNSEGTINISGSGIPDYETLRSWY